jgi:hypothetical protein
MVSPPAPQALAPASGAILTAPDAAPPVPSTSDTTNQPVASPSDNSHWKNKVAGAIEHIEAAASLYSVLTQRDHLDRSVEYQLCREQGSLLQRLRMASNASEAYETLFPKDYSAGGAGSAGFSIIGD